MIEVKICEKCGLVHPTYHEGFVCRDKWCSGKLKLHRISEGEDPKDEEDSKDGEQ